MAVHVTNGIAMQPQPPLPRQLPRLPPQQLPPQLRYQVW